MIKAIAMCALCVCSFAQTVQADNPIERVIIEFDLFGAHVRLELNFEEERKTLPEGYAPCEETVFYEGDEYCVFNDACGDGDGYLRKCDEPDAPFVPYRVLEENSEVRPPVASASDDHSSQTPAGFVADASISYNLLTDAIDMSIKLPVAVSADRLPRPGKRSGVSVGVLGHSPVEHGVLAGSDEENPLISAGSIVRIHGGAEAVVAYLVNGVGVWEATALTSNSEISLGISPDLGLPGTYHVWTTSNGMRVILRSFTIPTKDGQP